MAYEHLVSDSAGADGVEDVAEVKELEYESEGE